jgi:hypothetical protein
MAVVALVAAVPISTVPAPRPPPLPREVPWIPGRLLLPVVAVDGRGDAVVAWSGRRGGRVAVRVVLGHPNGRWTSPATVSAPGEAAVDPAPAVGTSGEAIVLWRAIAPRIGDNVVVRGTSRPAGGAWSRPLRVSQPAGALVPRVAIDARGRALAVWPAFRIAANRVCLQAVERGSPGRSWTTAANLSRESRGYFSDVSLALSPRGDAVVVWSPTSDAPNRVLAVRRTAGGDWTRPLPISRAAAAGDGDPQVAVDPSGRAVAVWTHLNGHSNRVTIEASASPPGGPWSAPVELSHAGRAAGAVVDVGPGGGAIAAWFVGPERQPVGGAPALLQVAERTRSGRWLAPVTLGAPGRSTGRPNVAIDGAGRRIVVWDQDGAVLASGAGPGEALGPPQRLSDRREHARGARLAVDGRGRGLVVWERSDAPGHVVRARREARPGRWRPVQSLSGGERSGNVATARLPSPPSLAPRSPGACA